MMMVPHYFRLTLSGRRLRSLLLTFLCSAVLVIGLFSVLDFTQLLQDTWNVEAPYPPPDEVLPWHMGGEVRPEPAPRDPITKRRIARLWPEEDPGGDRVTNQLMFVPPDWEEPPSSFEGGAAPPAQRALKTIFLNEWPGWPDWDGLTAEGRAKSPCPVSACDVTQDRAAAATADAVLFIQRSSEDLGVPRPPNQVWILLTLESPFHTMRLTPRTTIDWTANYRSDSDLVAPYARWQYFDPRVTQRPLSEVPNYAVNKTKKVAWFVSNCYARNNRMQFAQELAKHIEVDIYGRCGSLQCGHNEERCGKMLENDYKFYLAFENSNCREYITEKFFHTGLQAHHVVPIAMGARPEDYARAAPAHSYILVHDFASPKALADFLHELDRDDARYNAYFRWRGTGRFVDTHFFCRLCALLHDEDAVARRRARTADDYEAWWRGPGVCSNSPWPGSKQRPLG